MRKTGIYGLLSVAALMLAGCQTDLADGHRDEVPIALATTVQVNHLSATRAATDVLSGTQFDADETFYAYFPTGARIGDANSACGTTFTTDGSGGTTPATAPYFNATVNSVNVCAYYPYVEGKQVTNATTSFSVETDQTSTTGYKKSDLMYATASIGKSLPTANLTFTHRMSKIIVNATIGAGINSISAVRIVGGSKTIAIANPTTTNEASAAYLGSVSTADADQITAAEGKYIALYSGEYTSTDAALACAGLIPPQTVGASAETAFLQVVTDKGTATYSVNNKAFVSGLSYTYNITIAAASIGITTDITNWDDQGTTNLENYGNAGLGLCPPAGVEVVDLGLPSGTLWANRNIGATSDSDYGLYFQWGDVVGHSATDGYDFSWANYKWNPSGNGSTFTKYTGSDYTWLLSADDAATANWGVNWRMPTSVEFEELVNNTTNAWTDDYNGTGVAGYTFTGNGHTLFLPAGGYRDETSAYLQGSRGYYWSSTLDSDSPDCAFYLYFLLDMAYDDNLARFFCCPVRPVWESDYGKKNPLWYVAEKNCGSGLTFESDDNAGYFHAWSSAMSNYAKQTSSYDGWYAGNKTISGVSGTWHLPTNSEWMSILPYSTNIWDISGYRTDVTSVCFGYNDETKAGIADHSYWVKESATVMYAIRFIGTDYCSVWKYELLGGWSSSDYGYLRISSTLIGNVVTDSSDGAASWWADNIVDFGNNPTLGQQQRVFYARGHCSGASGASATYYPGVYGPYWSSTQTSSTLASIFSFGSDYAYCGVGNDKTNGRNIRLFRDN